MDVDAIGDFDTNKNAPAINVNDDEFSLDKLLKDKKKVKRERRGGKIKKKPIDMKNNGELINSIRLDKIMVGSPNQPGQIDEYKKLFELAGLSKRQTKKILKNENNLMNVISGIITEFDPDQMGRGND